MNNGYYVINLHVKPICGGFELRFKRAHTHTKQAHITMPISVHVPSMSYILYDNGNIR